MPEVVIIVAVHSPTHCVKYAYIPAGIVANGARIPRHHHTATAAGTVMSDSTYTSHMTIAAVLRRPSPIGGGAQDARADTRCTTL